MYDIIKNKRDGQKLGLEEIAFFIEGYSKGEIPDYQAAALLMAIYLKGMDKEETAIMTDCMSKSGDTMDLSSIKGIKVDKHSTGGVGDKTSLVVGPIVAACGVPVPKMSGRGLGHTGGTIDKLESIPGLSTEMTQLRFLEIINQIGVAIAGQTGELAPADKKVYALRDVTATVESIPLIAASIMSKKLASGADAILLDVKSGSGAFMKTQAQALELAQAMVDIGQATGRKIIALITEMDRPLGRAIGNSLEVIEAIETLKGVGPEDFSDLCLILAANMLFLAGKSENIEACKSMAQTVLRDGSALKKFRDMVVAQGGDYTYIDNPNLFEKAPIIYQLKADRNGWIFLMDAEAIGKASVILGAGRAKIGDKIDLAAGVKLCKKTGDKIKEGDILAELHTGKADKIEEAEKMLKQAIIIADQQPKLGPLVKARVEVDKEQY